MSNQTQWFVRSRYYPGKWRFCGINGEKPTAFYLQCEYKEVAMRAGEFVAGLTDRYITFIPHHWFGYQEHCFAVGEA